jgi:hypothetical protein
VRRVDAFDEQAVHGVARNADDGELDNRSRGRQGAALPVSRLDVQRRDRQT